MRRNVDCIFVLAPPALTQTGPLNILNIEEISCEPSIFCDGVQFSLMGPKFGAPRRSRVGSNSRRRHEWGRPAMNSVARSNIAIIDIFEGA